MKRYGIGEKVRLIPIEYDYLGMKPKYQPFERVRAKSKNGLQIIQRQVGRKITFYLEDIHSGKQDCFVSEDSGLKSWEKIKQYFDYYKDKPLDEVITTKKL